MSAVLDKPRAKAKPKAEKSALQGRLDKIFTNLKLGQEKLQLAHHSVGLTDPGDAPEILLRAVIEDMLPPAIAPMYRQPLTRAEVDAAYTGMFTSLAAIDGVIALSRGQVIEDTLRDAWVLLDEANSLMDFTDMKDALPEADVAGPAEIPFTPAELALHAEDRPAVLDINQVDRLTAKFDRANASLSMLMVIFGDDSPLEVRDSEDRDYLMGLVQHADNLLNEAHREIMEIDGRLPEDARWRTFEAHCIVGALERIEFDRGFSFETFPGPFLAKYLESAIDCIDRAHTALTAHWENRDA